MSIVACTQPPIYFKSSLHHLEYAEQDKCCVSCYSVLFGKWRQQKIVFSHTLCAEPTNAEPWGNSVILLNKKVIALGYKSQTLLLMYELLSLILITARQNKSQKA